MTVTSIIVDLTAFFVPAALLVLIKRFLQKSKGSFLKNAIAYLYSFVAINWLLILLCQHWGRIRHEPIKYLMNKLHISLNYLFAAVVLAVLLPLTEHFIKYIALKKLPGIYPRIGLSPESPVKKSGIKHIVRNVLIQVFLLIVVLATFGFPWLKNTFAEITINDIIFTLRMPLDGTSHELVYSFINRVIVPAIFFIGTELYAVNKLTSNFRIIRRKIKKDGAEKVSVWFPVKFRYFFPFIAIWCVLVFFYADERLDIKGYIRDSFNKSTFIEEEYVFPDEVKLTFPQKKRNLIYIYIESGETTVQDKASGGLFEENCIPEMTELAKENISFSENDKITGAVALQGCTFTMGGITAQSAGLPLTLINFMERYEKFMPNTVTLGDILEKEGYHNYFMCGSDLTFAGRDKYFKQHGNYECFDYFTAIEEGKIDKDYKVWWGYEDKKLYEYAKEKVTMLAASDQPFNFTMLTVDTHHMDGYVCDLCEDKFDTQYYNVYACTSRQVNDFVQWIKEQDFYENTTVIICGDHLSMDAPNFSHVNSDERRVYNCFINSAVRPVKEKNRLFSTMDFFPTTLAAIGVDIEGERLGLGVNLFSNEPTLCEKYGYDYVNQQLKMRSDFYNNTLLYNKEKE